MRLSLRPTKASQTKLKRQVMGNYFLLKKQEITYCSSTKKKESYKDRFWRYIKVQKNS